MTEEVGCEGKKMRTQKELWEALYLGEKVTDEELIGMTTDAKQALKYLESRGSYWELASRALRMDIDHAENCLRHRKMIGPFVDTTAEGAGR
ncbi:MAG: hypothetical protein ACXABY_19190 [Candidatus Thorarchaeota archaeon]